MQLCKSYLSMPIFLIQKTHNIYKDLYIFIFGANSKNKLEDKDVMATILLFLSSK